MTNNNQQQEIRNVDIFGTNVAPDVVYVAMVIHV